MVNNYVIFITIAIFLDWSCTQVISQCIQKSPCSCVLPDGTGYDFSNLTKEGLVQHIILHVSWFFSLNSLNLKLTISKEHLLLSNCLNVDWNNAGS